MPERLDRVQIILSRGVAVMPFDSRDELIAHLEAVDEGSHAIRAFRAAGGSSPVNLDSEDKHLIVVVIDHWTADLAYGFHDLPAGIWDLRNALFDDLHDVAA